MDNNTAFGIVAAVAIVFIIAAAVYASISNANVKIGEINRDIELNEEQRNGNENDSADGGEVRNGELPRDSDGSGSSGGGNNRGLGS